MTTNEIIPVAFQLGLLIAALWLSWETRNLRKTSSEAIRYNQQSDRQRVAPEIRLQSRLDTAGNVSAVFVRNVSTNLVVNSVVFVHDGENHNYLVGAAAKDFILPGLRTISALNPHRFNLEMAMQEICRLLTSLDGPSLSNLVSNVVADEPGRSVIACVFFDSLRNPYVRFRLAEIEGSRFRYKASKHSGYSYQLERYKAPEVMIGF